MTWPRLHTLRTRLFWLVLLTLVPAMLLHVASALEKRRMMLSAAQENLKSIADLAAGNIESILANAGDVLYGLTQRREIVSLDPEAAERLLLQSKEIFPNFSTLSLLGLDGSLTASTTSTGYGLNYSDRPWVRRALETHSLAIGGFRSGKRSGLPGIALARPVLDSSGQTIGLCTLSMRLKWFTDIFAKTRMPQDAVACLLDDKGVILATWPEIPQRLGAVIADVDNVLAQASAATETSWAGAGPDNTRYRFVMAPVRAGMNAPLLLRVGIPEHALAAPLETVLRRDTLVLGLTLALALVAAHFFSRAFVLRPTEQLARMAGAMASGDLDRRSGMAEGRGEMADLGRALDAMADTLRERIRFTQELIDAIPAPVFYKDLDGHYLGCNMAYERNIRLLAAIRGKTTTDVESQAQAARCLEMDREAAKMPGRTVEYETALDFKDGSPHDVIVFKSIFKNASGEPAGIVGVVLDITARKHSESALAASETKYRTLLASMRDGFVVADNQERLTQSNPAFQEMLGYSGEELARMTYRDITPAIWHEAEAALLRTSVAEQGFSEVFEKEYRRKDGSVLPVALRLHRYPAQAGDDCRYFAIVRDITDVKAIEADLRQAKETAETASRAKSDFLAKMSHEIRTPLHAVIGMTELTLGTPLSAQQRDALETVREAAGNLLDIINDILDISRIEARRLELAREDFDLRRTLAGVARTLRPQAARKGLSLSLAVSPDVPRFVRGDQGRLRQILLNLVGNALKFTEQGGVALAARACDAANRHPGKHLVEFVVADTGIGIPRDRLEGIFDMFTQADASVSRHYGGTGLGLAICRELSRLMDGVIEAESRPGQGSAFRVRLPLEQAKSQPVAPPEKHLPGVPPLPQRPLHILLAEDNPVNIKVAATYLARHGHKAVVAENGRLALGRLSEQPFDLVLMDVEMPEVDGLEATRRLRAGQAGPVNRDIPVVAMTAHALSGAMERCLAAGMTGYLPKPLDFQALDAILGAIPHNGQTAPGPSLPTPFPEKPHAAGEAPILDVATALHRLGDDRDLLLDIQNDFLRQYPRKLRLIALCSDNENWSEAALAAHSLKNIAGAVGAESSRLLAGRLEERLRAADDLGASDILNALKKNLASADAAIKTWREASLPDAPARP